MSKVRFNPLAEKELIEAAEVFEAEREKLGSEFVEEISRAVDFAVRFPEAAPRVRGPLRSLVVSRFPYSVIYRPLRDGGLRVLAVAHHKRRPGYWHGRQ